MPRTATALFDQWRFKCKLSRHMILWNLSLFVGIWKIQIKRNNKFFRNKRTEVEAVVRLQDMNRSLAAILQGSQREKSKIKTSRELPPMGVLKLSFNGGFVKEIRQGGWRVVIRDSIGQFLNQFSGLVECFDSNGAEVYAMLMGYRELLKDRKSLRIIIFNLYSGDLV